MITYPFKFSKKMKLILDLFECEEYFAFSNKNYFIYLDCKTTFLNLLASLHDFLRYRTYFINLNLLYWGSQIGFWVFIFSCSFLCPSSSSFPSFPCILQVYGWIFIRKYQSMDDPHCIYTVIFPIMFVRTNKGALRALKCFLQLN